MRFCIGAAGLHSGLLRGASASLRRERRDMRSRFRLCQAYAGQVSLLDACVGALLEYLEANPAGQNTLFTFASARGFPLGEHGRVGAYDLSLHGELVHVPLWMRFPDSLGQAVRSRALVRPADLCPTLLDWWGIADPPQSPDAASLMPLVREEVESIRDRLGVVDDGVQRAIRTPAWCAFRKASLWASATRSVFSMA